MTELLRHAPAPFAEKRVDPPLLRSANSPIETVAQWEEQRRLIEADWREYLGSAPYTLPDLNSRIVREDSYENHKGTLVELQTEPDYWEECYLMVPDPKPAGKLPAVVVFFYDVDTPSGHNMGSRIWKEGNETRQFARHLVDRGYVTLAQRWCFEGFVDQYPSGASLDDKYGPAVERWRQKAPHWKGLGRVAADASRCVDFLHTLDYVDPNRIGCMGHSLGGKMAFYAGAFDSRYRCVVSSELGIGLPFSNWEAPWYLGPEIRDKDFPRDHHQLAGLIAPRPFLLIAGEDADGDKSWAYLNTAQDVYKLYGAEEKIGMFNHRTGHSPTMESCRAAYDWFDQYL